MRLESIALLSDDFRSGHVPVYTCSVAIVASERVVRYAIAIVCVQHFWLCVVNNVEKEGTTIAIWSMLVEIIVPPRADIGHRMLAAK